MMGKRHDTIGIKQVVRLEWMQQTVNLVMAGLDVRAIRQELHDYLAGRKGSGTPGERGHTSRSQVINMLVGIWVTPDPAIQEFRCAALEFLQANPNVALAIHWGMICAAYPFWFSTAMQTGRLLRLQDQVAQSQIINRLKEQYGDRETVSRYGRYVIRSFVAWGVLNDSDSLGCYERSAPMPVGDPELFGLLIEGALHAIADGRSSLALLCNNPGLFPFDCPVATGDRISACNRRIDLVRHGLDEASLYLKKP